MLYLLNHSHRLGPRHREIWFGSYGDWSGGPEREPVAQGGAFLQVVVFLIFNSKTPTKQSASPSLN